MLRTDIHSPAVQYRHRLNFLNFLAPEDWEERFILSLMLNDLKLSAQPSEPYHVMAPMPRLGSVITWDQAYIVERTPPK